jgi:lipopolysaccharide export system protein LptA
LVGGAALMLLAAIMSPPSAWTQEAGAGTGAPSSGFGGSIRKPQPSPADQNSAPAPPSSQPSNMSSSASAAPSDASGGNAEGSAENGSAPAVLTAPGTTSKTKKRTAAAHARSDGEAAKGKSAAASKGNSGEQATPFSALQFSSGHGPIDVKADTLDLDYKKNTVTFNGHVRAAQADAQLTSDTLKVFYGKDFHEVKQMFADGDVRMSQGTRSATGDHAVLDQAAHTVVLTGNPVVHDGEDQVTGNRIIVHLDTGKSEVEGARAVFFPKEQKTRDNKGTLAHAS